MRSTAAMLLVTLSVPIAASADEARPASPARVRFTRAAAVATPLRDAVTRDAKSERLEARARRQADTGQRERASNWIRRHPACFGSIVGFMAGFAIGFLPGDDAVFDDFDASFNGLVIGGIGAAAGAIVGALSK